MNIEMKLAEYDLETGKFKQFLELGLEKHFLYGGDIIAFHNPKNQYLYRHTDICGRPSIAYNKDKTDPLNRFNGLFDGRTYGNGKFVLVINGEDDILTGFNGDYYWCNVRSELYEPAFEQVVDNLGDIHENPELFNNI